MDRSESNKLDSRKNTLDKSGVLRFDFLFSYWVFIWAIAFYFIPSNSDAGQLTKLIRHYLSPIVALYIALLENVIKLILMLYTDPQILIIGKFIAMITVIKLFPLYLLRNHKTHLVRDIFAFISVFAVYNVYLAGNDTNIFEIYERTYSSIISGQNNTPLFALIERIFKPT